LAASQVGMGLQVGADAMNYGWCPEQVHDNMACSSACLSPTSMDYASACGSPTHSEAWMAWPSEDMSNFYDAQPAQVMGNFYEASGTGWHDWGTTCSSGWQHQSEGIAGADNDPVPSGVPRVPRSYFDYESKEWQQARAESWQNFDCYASPQPYVQPVQPVQMVAPR